MCSKEEFVVGVPKKKHLKLYDKFLKSFQYRNALDAALSVSLTLVGDCLLL